MSVAAASTGRWYRSIVSSKTPTSGGTLVLIHSSPIFDASVSLASCVDRASMLARVTQEA